MNISQTIKNLKISPNSKVGCLVSGGVDSMVLFELLSRENRRIPFELTVIHFNYHLRGEESDRDEAFVHREAKKRNVPFVSIQSPLKNKTGVQNMARNIRFAEIDRLAKKGWTHFFLGHQADDQLETVIMRSFRGAGTKGLRGIAKERGCGGEGLIVRPLLGVTRKEILAFAKKENIPFMEDSSNAKADYLRNRVRHKIVSDLKQKNPNIATAVEKFCTLMERVDRLYEEEAGEFLSQYCSPYPIDDYLNLSEPARFKIIERSLKERGYLKQVSRCHFEEIEELFYKRKPVTREYGKVLFRSRYGVFDFVPYREEKKRGGRWIISKPGCYWIEPVGVNLDISLSPTLPTCPELCRRVSHSPTHKRKPLFLSHEKIHFPLTVRFPRPGDRFTPFGLKGSKKLSDYFTDRKVPREDRQNSLVLCQQDRIICLVGHEIDHDYRVVGDKVPCLSVSTKLL